MKLKGLLFLFTQQFFALFQASLSVGVKASRLREALKLLHPESSPAPLIRVGSDNDGGYLIPDDLEGIRACFSPGVADNAGFELSMTQRGIRAHLADYSVERPPIENDLFEFQKLYVGTANEPGLFVRIDDWVLDKAHVDEDLILQMDIEGGEYPILSDLSPQVLSRFRIMVLELHGLDVILTNSYGLELFASIFKKLKNLFAVVHIHPNNFGRSLNYMGIRIPQVIEITLIRRDRLSFAKNLHEPQIPNSLDMPNNPGTRDVILTKDWIG